MKKIIVMMLLLIGQLALGMDVPAEEETLDMQLMRATERGNLVRVTQILDEGANVNAEIDGMTPLFVAANGRVAMVRLLLDRGANINAVATFDAGRSTALGRAAATGNFGVVLELLTFIPLADRKAIRDNVLGLLYTLKNKGSDQGRGKQMPSDIRRLVGQETINRVAQELMPRVLERARLLLATSDAHALNGTTREFIMRLRDQAAAGNLGAHMPRANDYQAIIDLLDIDSPASQAILVRQVAAHIRRIVANPPAVPEQNAKPQGWYQRAKEKVQGFLKPKKKK